MPPILSRGFRTSKAVAIRGSSTCNGVRGIEALDRAFIFNSRPP